jgi:hypothetical protein
MLEILKRGAGRTTGPLGPTLSPRQLALLNRIHTKGNEPMHPTHQKITEAYEILTAILHTGRFPANMCRAHRLLESALGDFFDDADDVAGLPEDLGNERVGELRREPPF